MTLRGLRAHPYLGFALQRRPRKLPHKRIRISLGILSKHEKRLPLQLLHHESDTTRKRPTMTSRISGSYLSGTMRPDCGKWRSRSTAEKIRAIVRSAYCSESLAM